GEHPDIPAKMAICNQVESAGGVPQTIGIYVAARRGVTRGGVIADLGRSSLRDGSRDTINRPPMFAITFILHASDGDNLLHVTDVGVALLRQGRRHLVQGRVEGRLNLRA